MRLALAKEPGKIVYELSAPENRGSAVAVQGETFHPGWSKWEVTVEAVLVHAELHRDMKNSPAR